MHAYIDQLFAQLDEFGYRKKNSSKGEYVFSTTPFRDYTFEISFQEKNFKDVDDLGLPVSFAWTCARLFPAMENMKHDLSLLKSVGYFFVRYEPKRTGMMKCGVIDFDIGPKQFFVQRYFDGFGEKQLRKISVNTLLRRRCRKRTKMSFIEEFCFGPVQEQLSTHACGFSTYLFLCFDAGMGPAETCEFLGNPNFEAARRFNRLRKPLSQEVIEEVYDLMAVKPWRAE